MGTITNNPFLEFIAAAYEGDIATMSNLKDQCTNISASAFEHYLFAFKAAAEMEQTEAMQWILNKLSPSQQQAIITGENYSILRESACRGNIKSMNTILKYAENKDEALKSLDRKEILDEKTLSFLQNLKSERNGSERLVNNEFNFLMEKIKKKHYRHRESKEDVSLRQILENEREMTLLPKLPSEPGLSLKTISSFPRKNFVPKENELRIGYDKNICCYYAKCLLTSGATYKITEIERYNGDNIAIIEKQDKPNGSWTAVTENQDVDLCLLTLNLKSVNIGLTSGEKNKEGILKRRLPTKELEEPPRLRRRCLPQRKSIISRQNSTILCR